MEIGLFFGSFDPVHLGHEMIVSNILKKKYFNQIWIILSPQSPHKTSQIISKKEDRLCMLNKTFNNTKNIFISNVEFELQKPNYTIDTMLYLKKKFPNHVFSLIMGSDNFLKIHTWKNYKDIINNYKFYVYPRKGHDVTTNLSQKENIIFLDFPTIQFSSKLIRLGISKKNNMKDYLTKPVLEYILLKKIY